MPRKETKKSHKGFFKDWQDIVEIDGILAAEGYEVEPGFKGKTLVIKHSSGGDPVAECKTLGEVRAFIAGLGLRP